MTDLKPFRKRLDALLADYNHAKRRVVEEKAALAKAKAHADDMAEAQVEIQKTAERVQQTAHSQIANVVSRCLHSVFGEDAYEFKIDFAKKRGKTEANLQFHREGSGTVDPTDAAGGGVVDVAAFALRLSCLLLATPRKRRVLFLDEPMRMLSREFIPATKNMLLSLTEELGIQIVMVTHNSGLACGKIMEL